MERKPMYRLVFCDLDGTVATFGGEVRPAVREAMQAAAGAHGACRARTVGARSSSLTHLGSSLILVMRDVLIKTLADGAYALEDWQSCIIAHSLETRQI